MLMRGTGRLPPPHGFLCRGLYPNAGKQHYRESLLLKASGAPPHCTRLESMCALLLTENHQRGVTVHCGLGLT